jgi:hypothetical protein
MPKIKRFGDGDRPVGRAGGVVCSKDASSAFIPYRHASAIAASAARRRRENGRDGKRNSDIGRQRRANGNGMVKAGATGSASKVGYHQNQRQLTTPRG